MITQKIVLSIAGSDNTGGAGIQADIKTCCAFGIYAATVITGVTAQNSIKVFGVESVSIRMLEQQFDSIFEVMRPDAVKTGMLPSSEIIEVVACKLREYGVSNIIVDPVMVATNGGALVSPGKDIVDAFTEKLLPIATVMTPNISEASRFLNRDTSVMDPETVCRLLKEKTSCMSILLKGGHSHGDVSADYLLDSDKLTCFESHRINTPNTHGTGCTLSSAIACGLAKGETLTTAVSNAKSFIDKAIASAATLHVMNGPGPLDFFV